MLSGCVLCIVCNGLCNSWLKLPSFVRCVLRPLSCDESLFNAFMRYQLVVFTRVKRFQGCPFVQSRGCLVVLGRCTGCRFIEGCCIVGPQQSRVVMPPSRVALDFGAFVSSLEIGYSHIFVGQMWVRYVGQISEVWVRLVSCGSNVCNLMKRVVCLSGPSVHKRLLSLHGAGE